ncbi:MAG: hypothetical protein R2717_01695 [Schumannella sp.]
MAARRTWVPPAIAGIAAVALGLGAAELVAALIAPAAGPLLVIGAATIDLAPSWAKDAAIALFGTADKAALLVGIGVVLVLAAGAAGVLEAKRPPVGRVIFAAGAILGVAAALTRAGASPFDAVPSTVAAIVAAIALGSSCGASREPHPPHGSRPVHGLRPVQSRPCPVQTPPEPPG